MRSCAYGGFQQVRSEVGEAAAFSITSIKELLVERPVDRDGDALRGAAHCVQSGCRSGVGLFESGHHPVSAGWSRVGCLTTPAHLMT